MGGASQHPNDMAKSIHTWCVKRAIYISATHIAGVENKIADCLSRKRLTKDLSLLPHKFDKIVSRTLHPDVDLFASSAHHQLKCYVSWKTDPGAWAIDAFSLSRSDITPYIFPPFCLTSRILDKISRDQSPACILIAPMWTAQPWFPQLLHMLIANPIKLPEDCLISPPHQPIPTWPLGSSQGTLENKRPFN